MDAERGGLPPTTSDDEEAPDDVPKKRIDHQWVTRGIVLLAALIVSAGGGFAVYMSVLALSSSSSLLEASFGSERASMITTGSLVTGILVVLLGLLGVIGTYRRKKPCLWLFGVLVGVLLAFVASCILITTETADALDQWQRRSYRLYAPTNLTAATTELLHGLYVEVGALYAFCGPNATRAHLAKAALAQRVAPDEEAALQV